MDKNAMQPLSAMDRKGKHAPSEEFFPYQDLLKRAKKGLIDPAQVLKDEQDAARREAEKLVNDAKERSAAIERESRDQGFEKGRQEGVDQGRLEFEDKIRHMDTLLGELIQAREQLFQQQREELLQLVKIAVERLVHNTVAIEPRVIDACLREAMQFVVDNAVVRVRINPEDYARIMEGGIGGTSFLQGAVSLQMIEDDQISAGGCILQTDFGEVDVSLESCRQKLFAAIDKTFHAALQKKQEQGAVE